MADEWDELYRKWGAPRQTKKKRFVSMKAAIALFSILVVLAVSFIVSNYSSTNISVGGSASSGSPAQEKGTDSPLVYSDNKSHSNSISPQGQKQPEELNTTPPLKKPIILARCEAKTNSNISIDVCYYTKRL